MGERNYSKATEAALFAISLKCYYPDCPVPSVSILGGETKKNVQIAHIVAVSPNGPRYRKMSKEERDGFTNLILLCGYHHPRIDKKKNENKYPEELLREWKEQNEKDLADKVHGLDRLTQSELNDILVEAAESTKDEIFGALNELKDISEGAADLLSALFEKIERDYVNSEAAELLYAASQRLLFLEEGATLLYDASSRMGHLEEGANLLDTASQRLSNLEQNAAMLHSAAQQLDSMHLISSSQRLEQFSSDYAMMLGREPEIPDISASVESAGNNLIAKLDQRVDSLKKADAAAIVPIDDQRWKFAAWGFVLGVVAVLVTVAILAYSGAFAS